MFIQVASTPAVQLILCTLHSSISVHERPATPNTIDFSRLRGMFCGTLHQWLPLVREMANSALLHNKQRKITYHPNKILRIITTRSAALYRKKSENRTRSIADIPIQGSTFVENQGPSYYYINLEVPNKIRVTMGGRFGNPSKEFCSLTCTV